MKLPQPLIPLALTFLLHTPLSIAQGKNPVMPGQIPEFPIYVEANTTSKVAENANLNTPLIKIIQQKNWIKVGDRSNGIVGWIQAEDYQNALKAAYPVNTQSVFINVQEKSDKQPASTEIVAYKNGKKLDEKEAKALYQQMKKNQAEKDRAMGQWLRSMNSLFNTLYSETFIMPNLVDHFHPVVFIEQPKPADKKVEKAQKTDQAQKPDKP